MEQLKAKLKKQGGFTLIEMLIVVAIIAILIAVSIPMVSGALERARDATDQANERAAKAEITLIYMGAAKHPTNAAYVAGSEISGLKYDAKNGVIVAGDADVDGYGKCTGNGSGDTAYCTDNHANEVLTVNMSATGVFSFTWGS